MLQLVPKVRFGRWWSAAGLFFTIASLLGLADFLTQGEQSYSWPFALFFSAIIAYIAPVFHFITQRTEEALDELTPHLSLRPEQVNEMRLGISRKSTAWFIRNIALGTGMWLLQSRLMADSPEAMIQQISASAGHFMSIVVPLFVWLTMICALGALMDNARLFRRLSKEVDIDLFDPGALTPFGRMAVSSTLMVIGTQASFSIMWLESGANPWTTIPPVIVTSVVLLYLLVAPVWPIHQALKSTKREEVALLDAKIKTQRDRDKKDYTALTPLLVYRREVLGAREWPFDLSIMARFGLYLVIVPLSWIGAALIENLVDLFVN